ncbi:MAG: PDZ domain-containing protein, partial [Lachnospiraceae bacterium]|nr:PDZ domain-containing protein [Lachnospiraceae bacterium]
CGLLFGLAAAGTFTAVMRYQAAQAEVEESTAADGQDSDASASDMEPMELSASESPSDMVEDSSSAVTDEQTQPVDENESEETEDAGGSTDDADENESTESNLTELQTESSEDTSSEADEASDGEEEETSEGASDTEELSATEKYAELLNISRDAAEKGNRYIVTVNAISTGTTWFESLAESSETYAGIILDITEQEILILTTGSVRGSESLRATFSEGTTADAYIKQYSEADDMVILAVSTEQGIGEELLASLESVSLADGDEPTEGDMVVAIGSPLGVVHSCDFGNIGYIGKAEPSLDSVQRVIYADVRTDPEKGTYLIDINGDLLGVAVPNRGDKGVNAQLARIVTIGSLKDTVDKLETGEKSALIGLEGFGVSFEMRYNDIPEGMYIQNVLTDSPAYNAGIKRGDIVTGINEETIRDVYGYSEILKSLNVGDEVTINIKRGSSAGEYREMTFRLLTGER